MPYFSQITLTGHIGRDPERGFIPNSNTELTKFSVAVATGYGDRKHTTWYNISIFGKQGESAAKHLSKGDAVTVTGELSMREYTDKNGVNRPSLDVRADRWSFAGSKPTGSGQPPVSNTPAAGGSDPFNDPIPFAAIRGLVL